MNVEPFVPWLLAVGLLTVRLTFAWALSPALSSFGVPASVRVALTIALAGLTFAARVPPPEAAAWAATPSLLLIPVLAEAFIGALLGLSVHLITAAFALAGRLMDVQVGFAIGSLFDPVTRTSANVLGTMTALLGVTLFMTSGAHLQLAQWLAQSIDVLPIGRFPTLDEPLRPLLAAGSMFVLGLALAAPVVAALLFTDLAIGVASRNMPQINVLILAMPVKVLIGTLVLMLSVRSWGPLVSEGFSHVASLLELR